MRFININLEILLLLIYYILIIDIEITKFNTYFIILKKFGYKFVNYKIYI